MKKYFHLLLLVFNFIYPLEKLKENKIHNYTIEDFVFLHCDNICYSITFPNRDAIIVNYPSALVTLLLNSHITSNYYDATLLEVFKEINKLIIDGKKKEACEIFVKLYECMKQ